MNLKIFSGRSNESLAQEIVRCLRSDNMRLVANRYYPDVNFGVLDKKRGFSDGELYIRYEENLRGCDVFIVQSTNQPPQNDEELRMMIDTAKLASASRVTAVIPYFGYARQDRKDKSRAPVSAVRKVKELVACGVDRLLVLDVHSSAVETAAQALNTPCDHLWAKPVFMKHMKDDLEFSKFMSEGFVVAGPDFGAAKFTRGYAEAICKNFGLSAPIALVEKRRDPSTGKTEVLNVMGDVNGKNILLVDDMIDTGGTIYDAEVAFKDRGAKRIWVLATHGVFSGEMLPRLVGLIGESTIERVFITDSIGNYNPPFCSKINIISVAPLLAEAIFRIHTNQSVSSLFE